LLFVDQSVCKLVLIVSTCVFRENFTFLDHFVQLLNYDKNSFVDFVI